MSDLELIEQAAHAFTSSSDSFEMCRGLVHSNFAESNPTGAMLLAVDQRGQLRTVGDYGEVGEIPREISLWDPHPVPEAIQRKTVAKVEVNGSSMIVVPFVKEKAPIGAIVLTTQNMDFALPSTHAGRVVGQLGAFYLDANGLLVRTNVTPSESSTDLSERQLMVLSLMSTGQTNAEIAREMLLSESTIRQETVRIYRALGVNNRSEATKKGRALGLISKTMTTPPPARLS